MRFGKAYSYQFLPLMIIASDRNLAKVNITLHFKCKQARRSRANVNKSSQNNLILQQMGLVGSRNPALYLITVAASKHFKFSRAIENFCADGKLAIVEYSY